MNNEEYRSYLYYLMMDAFNKGYLNKQNSATAPSTAKGLTKDWEKDPAMLKREESNCKAQLDNPRASGGDADRYFTKEVGTTFNGDNRSMPDQSWKSNDHLLAFPKNMFEALNCVDATPTLTPQSPEFRGESLSIASLRRMENNGNGSDVGSGRSQRSSKTVISHKSASDLRKLVTSHCKMQNELDETLKGLAEQGLDISEYQDSILTKHINFGKAISELDALTDIHCQHCSERNSPVASRGQIGAAELSKNKSATKTNVEQAADDVLSISVDDVVNTKVISPMVRKLQHVLLANLKEEMSLMEDLERLPSKVCDVYKAVMIQQNK